MRIFLARLVVAVTCGWTGCAYSQPSFLGNDHIQVDAFDPDAFPVSDHDGINGPSGVSSDHRTLSAQAGVSIASADVSYLSKPGLLSAFANAGAIVGSVGDGAFLRHGLAGANAIATAIMVDEWHFEFGSPTGDVLINANFNVSGSLTTTADGENRTPSNNGHDEIDSRAIATLFASGTGMANGPYLSHGPTDIWGYFEDDVLSLTINPHVRELPPATIPLTLAFSGGKSKEFSVPVHWNLGVGVQVSVDNGDIINRQAGSAIAIADYSHTLSWGGITSIIDVDTGEPITDYTLTSASGFDYTHPFSGSIPEPGSVPEPSSIGLLASCLALMLPWRSGVARHH